MIDEQTHRQDRDRGATAAERLLSRTARPRPLAALLAGGLATVMAFQVSLIAGAPWGVAAYGGSQTGQLPTDLRVASTLQAAFWLVATLTVLLRGGITTGPVPYSFSRRAVWALTAILAVGAVMNTASSSNWERFGWAPFVLALTILSLLLARSPIPEQGRIDESEEEGSGRHEDTTTGGERMAARSRPTSVTG